MSPVYVYVYGLNIAVYYQSLAEQYVSNMQYKCEIFYNNQIVHTLSLMLTTVQL